MVRAVVHSRKHISQLSQSNVAQNAILNTEFLRSIEATPTTPNQVREGANVKAVWVEVWLSNDSASALGSFTAGLYKAPGTAVAMTAANAAALHDYENKKNIYYVTQGLAPPTDGALMLLFKGWIKIPKSKQRMGLGDRLLFFVRNNNITAIDVQVCGLFLYKEYT